MAWFIHELPSSPVLLNRVLKLMGNHSDTALALSEATNLIRAQSLDASILNANPDAGRLLEEDLEDLDASPITSGQPDATAGHLASANSDIFRDCDSDAGVLCAPGRTPPPITAPAPAALVAAAAAGGAAAGDVGAVAAAGDATKKDTDANLAHLHKMTPNVHITAQKNQACKYLLRRMLRRKPGCVIRLPPHPRPRLCHVPWQVQEGQGGHHPQD